MRPGDSHQRDRLSALDSAFLFIESKKTPSHGGFLAYLEGPVDFERFRSELVQRVADLPRFRQVIRRVPLNLAHPVWEFSPGFRLDDHIEHIDMGGSATEADVHAKTLAIIHRGLDHRKPLWSIHVMNGIEGGRSAVVNMMHHCMVDGTADGVVTETLFSGDPAAGDKAPHWEEAPPHSGRGRLLIDAIADDAAGLANLLRKAPGALAWTLRAVRTPEFKRGRQVMREYRRAPALRFPFNKPPSGKLDFACGTFPLAELRALGAAFDTTINNVLLAAVTGAVQRYATDCGLVTAGKNFKYQIPANVRLPDQYGKLGNFSAAVPLLVPLDIDDAAVRLRVIHERMAYLKEIGCARGISRAILAIQTLLSPPLLSQIERLYGAPWLRRMQAALGRVPNTNMFVTNVPRREVPLYVAGRRILNRHVIVPLLPDQGMVCGAVTYDQQLEVSFTACAEVQPGPDTLMRYTIEGFRELSDASSTEIRNRTKKEKPISTSAG